MVFVHRPHKAVFCVRRLSVSVSCLFLSVPLPPAPISIFHHDVVQHLDLPPPSAPLAVDAVFVCVINSPQSKKNKLEEVARNALNLDVMDQEDELEAAGSRRTDRKNRNKASTDQSTRSHGLLLCRS